MPLTVFRECAALNKQNSPAGWTARLPGGPRPPVDRASRPGGFSLGSGGADVDTLVDAAPRDGPSLEDTVWRKSRWLVTASHAREPSSGRRRVTIVLAISQSRQKMCSGLEGETRARRKRGRRSGKEGGEIRLAGSKMQKGKKRKKGKTFLLYVIPSGLLMPGPAQIFSSFSFFLFFISLVFGHSMHTWSEFVERFCCLSQCVASGMFFSLFSSLPFKK